MSKSDELSDDNKLTLQEERFEDVLELMVPKVPQEYQKRVMRYPIKDCTRLKETRELMREMDVFAVRDQEGAKKEKDQDNGEIQERSRPKRTKLQYVKIEKKIKSRKRGEEKILKRKKSKRDEKSPSDVVEEDDEEDDDTSIASWLKK